MPAARECLHLLCDNRDKQTPVPAPGRERAREGLGCSQGWREELGCLILPLEVRCDEEEVLPRKHFSTRTDGFHSKDKHLRAHSREVTAAPEPHAMTSRRRGCCFLREDRVANQHMFGVINSRSQRRAWPKGAAPRAESRLWDPPGEEHPALTPLRGSALAIPENIENN